MTYFEKGIYGNLFLREEEKRPPEDKDTNDIKDEKDQNDRGG
jgi:hypothetical protein